MQASEIPVSGTLPCTYPRNGLILEKWGEMGKSVGNFGCSMEKWGILGLKRSKNMVLIGNKAMVGVHW